MRQFSAKKKARLLSLLELEYPEAKSALYFVDDYQLIVAVVLSAQCTDKKVNEVTPHLFARWPSFQALAIADEKELASIIRPINYYLTKARNLKSLAELVVMEWGGNLPGTIDELVLLPGVGRKTANVVVSERGTEPGLAVDTHVFRVSRRLGIAQGATASLVEEELRSGFPSAEWRSLHHRLILHGRAVCIARRPRCESCCLLSLCKYSVESKVSKE